MNSIPTLGVLWDLANGKALLIINTILWLACQLEKSYFDLKILELMSYNNRIIIVISQYIVLDISSNYNGCLMSQMVTSPITEQDVSGWTVV